MNLQAMARLELSLSTEPGHVDRDERRRGELENSDVFELADRYRNAETAGAVDAAIRTAEKCQLRWICPGDKEWPLLLDDLDHVEPLAGAQGAPWGLWVRGSADLHQLSNQAVAIVGARSCSSYGAEIAAELAADLSDAGFTVVSGAAYGIDACAHRGAMAARRPTIAVLACGADRAYPVAHTNLIDRIAGEGGLVLSEQVPGAEPMRHRFLTRNRIIAALSHGTVVVEAARVSGSLNTLNWADRLGRATMVVPGPVTSARSVGSHSAIRDGKAVLVTSGADVVNDLALLGIESH